MSREVMIPLSVVESLINTQRDFQRELVERLGFYLKEASEAYRDALNPPLESASVPMSYTTQSEEAEELLYQIDQGIISPADITDNMRKILAGAEMSFETN